MLGALSLVPACRRHAHDPSAAFEQLRTAVMHGDGKALFEALDQRTRWAWMTVQKSHREAYDIVLSNYPEGDLRSRAQRRFERAAELGSGRDLFAEEAAPTWIATLQPQLAAAHGPPAWTRSADGTSASALVEAGGTPLEFRLGEDGSWGYDGAWADADARQTRALRDVEAARASAADFERAAGRR
jgi:hypothetical protein